MNYFLAYEQLNTLLESLVTLGYRCLGPHVRDGNIVFDELTDSNQLPWGMREEQKPGFYRLHKTEKKEAFAWVNGAQALKPLLFKPKESLWKVARDEQGKMAFQETIADEKPTAIIGARACDLAGMLVQDKTFLQGKYINKQYAQHRNNLFTIVYFC